jgi:hypothetical protein
MFFRKPGQGQQAAPAAQPKIPAAGAPLAADVRARMEPRLGADLSGVKVSTSGESANAAGQLGARAFTVGNEVHFGAGQYAPGTKEGDRLIAHELTHAVQGQRQGVQRKEAEGAEDEAAGLDVSQPGDAAEVEADKVADGVADKLHGQANKKGEDKQGPEAGERPNGKDDQASDHGAGGAHADEMPAPISAKLEGVGTKVYAARGSAAPAPAAGAGAVGEAPGKEKAPEIGAKLAPGAISLARNNNPNQLSLPAPVGGQQQQQQHAGGQLAPHPEKQYVTVENGKYMLKPELRNSEFCRDRCYGKNYNSKVKAWKQKMLTTPKSKGGLRHETDPMQYFYEGKWYKNEGNTIASIGHEKPPVAQHWNDKGSKTTQPVRAAYYNGDGSPETNLILQPLSVNSSEGAAKGDRYTFEVSIDFRGPA